MIFAVFNTSVTVNSVYKLQLFYIHNVLWVMIQWHRNYNVSQQTLSASALASDYHHHHHQQQQQQQQRRRRLWTRDRGYDVITTDTQTAATCLFRTWTACVCHCSQIIRHLTTPSSAQCLLISVYSIQCLWCVNGCRRSNSWDVCLCTYRIKRRRNDSDYWWT